MKGIIYFFSHCAFLLLFDVLFVSYGNLLLCKPLKVWCAKFMEGVALKE